MSDRKSTPRDVDTSDRMATLARASADAMKHKAAGEHETEHGHDFTVPLDDVESVIESWPDAPREYARTMLDQYGAPNEATPTKLFWYHRGPWKRMLLTSDILVHNFPSPHSDFLTQWIDYRVPVDKFDDVGRFDGSCLVDRTPGEAGARCDSEAANILTLNMMHAIVTGELSVEQARETPAREMAAYTMGRSAPYAENFRFTVAEGGTEDPDKGMGAGPIAKEAAGKVKDVLTRRKK